MSDAVNRDSLEPGSDEPIFDTQSLTNLAGFFDILVQIDRTIADKILVSKNLEKSSKTVEQQREFND